MKCENKSLKDNKIREVVELPKRKTILGCRWVYKIKYNVYNIMDD